MQTHSFFDSLDYGQSVINLYVLLIGMGLKCYRGGFDSTEGAKHAPRQGETTLVDCDRTDDVCLSVYAKTEVELAGDNTYSAGTWVKYCTKKSNPFLKKDFDDNQFDGCIEAKQDVIVSNMDKYLFYVTSCCNFQQCFSNHCMKQVTF